jgi:hypothetical protein
MLSVLSDNVCLAVFICPADTRLFLFRPVRKAINSCQSLKMSVNLVTSDFLVLFPVLMHRV